jgi:hypothetical protein
VIPRDHIVTSRLWQVIARFWAWQTRLFAVIVR